MVTRCPAPSNITGGASGANEPSSGDDDDQVRATADAYQAVLAQQLRPLLGNGGWDQMSAMAAMHRTLLQQQQQQQQQSQQGAAQNQAAAAAAAALAAAAGLAATTGSALHQAPQAAGLPPTLWPYGINPATLAASLTNGTDNIPSANNGSPNQLSQHLASLQQQQQQQTPNSAAAAAAALAAASLGQPGSYLSQLQNLNNPDHLSMLQQNLMLLEQFQQRQLFASNPHLLMAAAAAAASSQSQQSSQQQQQTNLQQHHSSSPQHHQQNAGSPSLHHQMRQQQLQAQQSLLSALSSAAAASQQQQQQQQHLLQQHHSSHLTAGSPPNAPSSQANNTNSLLTTVSHAASLASGLTNQHQDSLVDQHFRRSLGEDYNQILANKTSADAKKNVGK